MRFAKFWAWGSARSDADFKVRGWSDISLAGAIASAEERAERLFQALKRASTKKATYAYGDRVLPEPVLSEIHGSDGTVIGAVTRNSYGALVLNTTSIMFVDIDFANEAPSTAGGFLSRLFGKSAESNSSTSLTDNLNNIKDNFLRERIDSARIYRTKNGLRLLLLHQKFDPDSSASEALLQRFGADDKYRKLCRLQQSYRARLTPKPWRCGVENLRVPYPFRTEKDQSAFETWRGEYESRCEEYRTCELIESIGEMRAEEDFLKIVELHDRETRIDMNLPLA